MRLLNTKTFDLVDFFDADRQPYVILSHRWEGRETTLQAFEAEKHLPDDQCSAGAVKVKHFCRFAAAEGSDWCWVDTVCIDKTSSAELTEAINSMYRWYREAEGCYVYLNDVSRRAPSASSSLSASSATHGSQPGLASSPPQQQQQQQHDEDHHHDLLRVTDSPLHNALRRSSWFTRGWTLQELLSPRFVYFLDAEWGDIGTREQLTALIYEITAIPPRCFGNQEEIRSRCVAERMSWMAGRSTSRAEDMAYCLLGVFDVYMPLIYGEGHNAFARLQQEIIRNTDDETVFAWVAPDRQTSGILARSPLDFSRHNTGVLRRALYIDRVPYQFTNKGLDFVMFGQLANDHVGRIILNCQTERSDQAGWVTIHIRQVGHGIWQRIHCHQLSSLTMFEITSTYPQSLQEGIRLYIQP